MRELRRLAELSGYALRARDGDVGKLKDIYFDDRDWTVRYLVVHTGSWLLGRDVLILPGMVEGVDDDTRRIQIELGRKQIEGAPAVEQKTPVSRHYEREYFRYYDWPPYWADDPLSGGAARLPADVTDMAPKEPEHPHLRSGDEVVGYRMRAQDGEVGKVRDFVVEDPGWMIRYVDVATGNWLSGRDVLFACPWIEGIDWFGGEVMIALDREAIETAPAYDSSQVISREYQIELYKHYGRHYEAD